MSDVHGGPASVDRALDLLEAVARSAEPVGAKALARELGCALSTVYHLLAPLTARGHVARTPGGYVLGPRVPSLYRSFQRHAGIDAGTRGLLMGVRRAAGAHAYLSVRRGGRIAVIDSTTAVTAHGADPFEVGLDQGAHATAHGKVLLASLPRRARRRYLDEFGLPRLTEHTITSPDRFEAELRRVRAAGVAVSVGETDPAYTCVAVPLGDGTRALSVSLPTAHSRGRRAELARILTRAARHGFPAASE
ncbi:IclR family transcriptional regulator [Streptomyces alboniger]|uniref:IclR family transcriptional regulator n=1 Tax=Streptomyces alboniger TaxID=132473 RepID=UPI000AC74214|nr:IclR family transcriptional regulator C-terminal domain-containing protein [Streptomyces alboniger]